MAQIEQKLASMGSTSVTGNAEDAEPRASILLSQLRPAILRPAYILVRDAHAKQLFFVVRGTHSVRDMISLAFSHVGMDLAWSGEDVDTIATDQNGVVRVRTNPKFFRPAEVDLLIGDPALAEKELGWVPKTSFEELVQMMVDADIDLLTGKLRGIS